jgi:hypothetical protein
MLAADFIQTTPCERKEIGVRVENEAPRDELYAELRPIDRDQFAPVFLAAPSVARRARAADPGEKQLSLPGPDLVEYTDMRSGVRAASREATPQDIA